MKLRDNIFKKQYSYDSLSKGDHLKKRNWFLNWDTAIIGILIGICIIVFSEKSCAVEYWQTAPWGDELANSLPVTNGKYYSPVQIYKIKIGSVYDKDTFTIAAEAMFTNHYNNPASLTFVKTSLVASIDPGATIPGPYTFEISVLNGDTMSYRYTVSKSVLFRANHLMAAKWGHRDVWIILYGWAESIDPKVKKIIIEQRGGFLRVIRY